MSDLTVPQLPAASIIYPTDLLYLSQSGTDAKATVAQLAAKVLEGFSGGGGGSFNVPYTLLSDNTKIFNNASGNSILEDDANGNPFLMDGGGNGNGFGFDGSHNPQVVGQLAIGSVLTLNQGPGTWAVYFSDGGDASQMNSHNSNTGEEWHFGVDWYSGKFDFYNSAYGQSVFSINDDGSFIANDLGGTPSNSSSAVGYLTFHINGQLSYIPYFQ